MHTITQMRINSTGWSDHTLNPREHGDEHSLGYLPIVYMVCIVAFLYFRYTQINRQLSDD